MRVIIEAGAQETIEEIAEFIDGINTPGAGDRWTDRILDFINDYAKPKVKYALCHNRDLADELFSCIIFNNWVIVFRIEKSSFIVYQVVSWKEVNLYSWKSKGNIITDEPIKLNDDGLDALRYALYSSKKSSGSGVWDYELVFA